MGTETSPSGRIVVAFDGSTGAITALHWAAREASLRGVGLELVYAWRYPGLSYPHLSPVPPPPNTLPDDLAESARSVLEDHDPVPVTCRTVDAPPGPALIEAADGAGMLVLGARRHHRIGAVTIGSVTRYCTGRAPCPVVAVPLAAHAAVSHVP